MKKLLRHVTKFEEYIDVEEVKNFGDSVDPMISINYTYDGIKYNVGFELDYSANAKSWTWDDSFEYEDDSDLHFIFRNGIYEYLNDHYI